MGGFVSIALIRAVASAKSSGPNCGVRIARILTLSDAPAVRITPPISLSTSRSTGPDTFKVRSNAPRPGTDAVHVPSTSIAKTGSEILIGVAFQQRDVKVKNASLRAVVGGRAKLEYSGGK